MSQRDKEYWAAVGKQLEERDNKIWAMRAKSGLGPLRFSKVNTVSINDFGLDELDIPRTATCYCCGVEVTYTDFLELVKNRGWVWRQAHYYCRRCKRKQSWWWRLKSEIGL